MTRQWLTLGICLDRGADEHVRPKRFPKSKDQLRGRFEVQGERRSVKGP